MHQRDLSAAIGLELRHLHEQADYLRQALDGDLTPLAAARLLVRLSEISGDLDELGDVVLDLDGVIPMAPPTESAGRPA